MNHQEIALLQSDLIQGSLHQDIFELREDILHGRRRKGSIPAKRMISSAYAFPIPLTNF